MDTNDNAEKARADRLRAQIEQLKADKTKAEPSPETPAAKPLSAREFVERRMREHLHEPIREIHMVGGVNPDLPFGYYLDVIRTMKRLLRQAGKIMRNGKITVRN